MALEWRVSRQARRPRPSLQHLHRKNRKFISSDLSFSRTFTQRPAFFFSAQSLKSDFVPAMKHSELEKVLGHKFTSPDLLERALTHRSWANEHSARDRVDDKRPENETLEFVGDSVVGLVVAEELFRRNPNETEGGLSLMKHSLVRTESLASAAERIGLAGHIRLSPGEDKIGGRKNPAILADTFEAVVAAIFLDADYGAARAFVIREMGDAIGKATPQASLDYKTLLQETLQANKMSAPTYHLVRTEGQPHDRTFYVEAVWTSGRTSGSGRSIKAAEMMAASNALEMLKGKPD
jgi:ribonuclease-3